MENELKKKTKKKKMTGRIIIILVVLAVVGAIAWFYFQGRKAESLIFETRKLETGRLVSVVSTTGATDPVSTVDVGSEVSGTIQVVNVDFNDRVKKGQVLVRIDQSIYLTELEVNKAQLRSARAEVQSARADLEKANLAVKKAMTGIYSARAAVEGNKAELASARSQLISAQAEVNKVKAQLENDLAEYKRAEALFRRELISASEKEKAYTKYLVTKAGYESTLAGIQVANARIESAKSKIHASNSSLNAAIAEHQTTAANVKSVAARITKAQAAVQQAQGSVDKVQVNLDRCTIKSPIDGIVINRKVEPGQSVAASFQTPVLMVLAENLQKMEVKAAVDEADIGKVEAGQEVKFTVDAYPDEVFKGNISQVRSTPTVQDNVVTYDVIIKTDNDKLKLKPGMTANIDITVQVKKKVLKIPNAALRFRPSRHKDFPYPEDVKKEMEKGRNDKSGARKGNGKKGGAGKPDGKAKRAKSKSEVWVLEGKQPKRYRIVTGITDNNFTEMVSGDLKDGMEVIVDAMTLKEQKKRQKRRRGMRVRL